MLRAIASVLLFGSVAAACWVSWKIYDQSGYGPVLSGWLAAATVAAAVVVGLAVIVLVEASTKTVSKRRRQRKRASHPCLHGRPYDWTTE